jgi:endonuclease/exonuclease/phosphatase family metal-dependent hydrolase
VRLVGEVLSVLGGGVDGLDPCCVVEPGEPVRHEGHPISRDFDFTVGEGWTAQAFKAKKQNLAAVLDELHGGLGPELPGVCEVEGDDVFEQLLAETSNSHWKVVKDASGTSDLRGIDVSLAFDDRKLAVVDARSHMVHLRYATRDIFEVVFELVETNERLVVIASHWPSRRQGRLESQPLRIAVAENIAFLVRDYVRVDSISYEQLRSQNTIGPVKTKWETPVLLLGDFNDEPFDIAVIDHLQASSEIDRVTGPPTRSKASTRKPPTTAATTPSSTTPPGASSNPRTSAPSSSPHLRRRGIPQPLPSTRPTRLHTRTPKTSRAAARPHKRRHLPRTQRRNTRRKTTPFNRNTLKGTSDHLPLIATLDY